MADPLTPEQRQRFNFEALNRAARRALTHRAKAARRSSWEQWRKENLIHPSGSNDAGRIVILAKAAESNFTSAPQRVPSVTEPTIPTDVNSVYTFKAGNSQ